MKDSLLAGKVVNTHGIKGELKIIYYTDSPDFFNTIDNVMLFPSGESFKVEFSRQHKGSVLLKLEGIDDISQALPFVGSEVYVSRSETKLPEGRFFIVDIIGLDVITDEGLTIGKVTDVFQTGKNDVYGVKGDDGKEYFIPVIDEVVKDINPKEGKIIIHPIKGLLDDED
ncbi:MAG: ribosome maturation factor RimM [Bacillota bacterium]|nr:ribosome maturation factor RimM [Bacillota bacterium]